MTTHELIQRLAELKAALRRDTEFVKLVETIAERYSYSVKNIDPILKSPNEGDRVANLNNFKSDINSTIDIIKQLSLPRVFIEIERTIERITQINYDLGAEEGGGLGNLIIALSEFQNDFEKLIKSYDAAQALQLISSAQALSLTLKVTINLVDLMIEKLISHVEIRENEEALSVLFPSTDEYRDVLIKLDALNDIYSELCPLFKVSTSQYPLRIIKVETGSLWVSVLGHAAVIGFIVWLLKKGAGYVYRNFTTEGKILSIPKQVEAADSILDFTKKLEESGVDTKMNKEELQKTLVTITKRLNSLIANQASVEINNEIISVGQAYEQKFLQDGKRLRLEEGAQSGTDEKQ